MLDQSVRLARKESTKVEAKRIIWGVKIVAPSSGGRIGVKGEALQGRAFLQDCWRTAAR